MINNKIDLKKTRFQDTSDVEINFSESPTVDFLPSQDPHLVMMDYINVKHVLDLMDFNE